jgi:hypothetical protein
MYRLLWTISILNTLTAAGCSMSDSASGDPVRSLLYAQDAAGGSLNATQLTLSGVHESTVWFSDRPYREAGHTTTTAFIELFSKSGPNSFADDPPNADFACEVSGVVVNHVVTLSNPVLSAGTLTYTISLIGSTADLDQFKPITCDGAAYLLIDNAQAIECADDTVKTIVSDALTTPMPCISSDQCTQLSGTLADHECTISASHTYSLNSCLSSICRLDTGVKTAPECPYSWGGQKNGTCTNTSAGTYVNVSACDDLSASDLKTQLADTSSACYTAMMKLVEDTCWATIDVSTCSQETYGTWCTVQTPKCTAAAKSATCAVCAAKEVIPPSRLLHGNGCPEVRGMHDHRVVHKAGRNRVRNRRK